MSEPTTSERSAALARDTGTTRFFTIALGFTWTLQLPVVLARYGVLAGGIEAFMPLAALGAFGPLVAAVLVARRDPAGVRGLLRSIVTGRPSLGWALVALGCVPAVQLAGTAVYRLFGGTGVQWLYLPETAEHVAALFLIPIVEEIGWRGVALPRLIARHGPLRGTALLGVGWALWHLMMFLLSSSSAAVFWVAVAQILVGSVVFSWLYLRTRGSLLVAILAHAGAHLDNASHAADVVAPVVCTVSLAVAAAAMLLGDRAIWRAPAQESQPAS